MSKDQFTLIPEEYPDGQDMDESSTSAAAIGDLIFIATFMCPEIYSFDPSSHKY